MTDRHAPPPRWLALLRLLRLPNVFTAWADILLGYWLSQPLGSFGVPATLALLIGATSGLYLAGMVLNDVCDFQVDAEERPWRPLPSGQISRRAAAWLAAALASAGLACAAFVGFGTAGVAAVLLAAVVAYDGGLKKTLAGPAAMGACRGLNVLLGMSPALGAAPEPLDEGSAAALFHALWWWLAPTAAAVYVAGLTVFARDEAIVSRRFSLGLGAALLAAGLGLHAWGLSRYADVDPVAWKAGGVVAAFLAFRCGLAILSPSPFRVQRAVVVGILNLCLIAAVWLVGVQGFDHAVWPALLMLPAVLLGRLAYST